MLFRSDLLPHHTDNTLLVEKHDALCQRASHNLVLYVCFLEGSGYQVGKEIIGTTVNTLLFAYLGGTILLFSYIQTQQYSLEIILNSQFLFQDVAAMLSGAVACLITVPVSIKCIIRQIS